MSDYMADLSKIAGYNSTESVKLNHGTMEDKTTLDFEDFLMLMVTQLKNQTIDNSMDTSEMMNQMTQMSVMQALSDISKIVEQSSSLNYAASLVGKTVTVGVRNGNEIKEVEGVVTGTGTLSGEQVIFIGDDCYYLNSVMAVGHLPEGEIKPNGSTTKPDSSTSTTTDPTDKTDKTENTENTENTDKTENTEPPAEGTDTTGDATESAGESGTPSGVSV